MVNFRKFPIIGRIISFIETTKFSILNTNNYKKKSLVEVFFDWYLDIMVNGFILWLPLRFIFNIQIPFIFFPIVGILRYVLVDLFDDTIIKTVKEMNKKK